MTSHLDAVRTLFDRWAEEGRGERMESGHRDVVLQMLDRADLKAHHHVLDLGCGTGWTVRLIAGIVPAGRTFGIDASEGMIEQALSYENPAQVAFSTGTVEALPYADDSLHRVVSMESIYYWHDIARGLSEVHRVLTPGGSFLAAFEYYTENPFTDDWSESLQLDLRRHSEAEYLEFLTAAGFDDVHAERLLDRRPTPTREEFVPGSSFPDYDRYLQYRATGALLIQGRKPGVEPPPSPSTASSTTTHGDFPV